MVLSWRNHPDVRRYMFTQHEISPLEHSQWFKKASQDSTLRLLIVQEHDSPLGYVQFSGVEPGGISYWGFYARPNAPKGTGRKLGAAALEHAFGLLQLHKVCGQAIASNHASIRFHESLGFTRDEQLRGYKRVGTHCHSLIGFGLLDKEWLALKQGNYPWKKFK